jgi:hypothetical protein
VAHHVGSKARMSNPFLKPVIWLNSQSPLLAAAMLVGLLFPIVGIIVGVFLLGRDEETAGLSMIVLSVVSAGLWALAFAA